MMLRWVVMAVTAALLIGSARPAMAGGGGVSLDTMVALQTAMLDHIDAVSVNDAVPYFDGARGQVEDLYPTNAHPMIVPYGDYYFLCADFLTAAGRTVNVDFLVAMVGDDYRVVQALVDQRDAVRAAIGIQ